MENIRVTGLGNVDAVTTDGCLCQDPVNSVRQLARAQISASTSSGVIVAS